MTQFQERMIELARRKLETICTSEEAQAWLETPQPLLNNQVPLKMLKGGRAITVLRVIFGVVHRASDKGEP